MRVKRTAAEKAKANQDKAKRQMAAERLVARALDERKDEWHAPGRGGKLQPKLDLLRVVFIDEVEKSMAQKQKYQDVVVAKLTAKTDGLSARAK